ncbi:MAG: flagellar basal body P-ring formation protein FlgA [Pseudomonadales bacterium]|nr:flagellar basal body P-ring formation protein FlgA [Pseudomonadales bacterium]
MSRQHRMVSFLRLLPLAGTMATFCFLSVVSSSALSAPDARAAMLADVLDFTEGLIKTEYPTATHTEISIQQPDQRMVIENCDRESMVQHAGAGLARRILVKISCAQPSALYIPVDISIYANAVTTAAAVPRNVRIRDDQLQLGEVEVLTNGRAFFTQFAEVAGMQARRAIRQGTVLTPGMLTAPNLVNRGDQVMIVADGQGLSVQMPGEALESGTRGQQIRVKNLSSKRIVKARITSEGQVAVRY